MKNNFIYGFAPNTIALQGPAIINYNNGVFTDYAINSDLGFTMTSLAVNDSSGDFLFYSNGLYVNNRFHNRIAGCDSVFIDSVIYTYPFYIDIGIGISNSMFSIPKPNDPNNYLVFQLNYDFSIFYQDARLTYFEVDMDADSGRGAVISCKNNVVYDTLADGFMTGVKHANGRDWWVVCNEAFTNKYYKVLVTPDTMLVSEQFIGPNVDTIDYTGQSNFSNDGNWYARADAYGAVIMQFDRCSGMFSNLVHDSTKNFYCGGVGFSPNNKFLYVSTGFDLYQYNLEDSANMVATKIHVSHTDSLILPSAPSFNTFYRQFLGPDNKLYVITQANFKAMNIINEPDSFGLACDVKQHAFPLLKLNQRSCPEWPNYDLGPVIGSVCDSLGLGVAPTATLQDLRISPNPAMGWFYINYTLPANASAIATLYDIMGNRIDQRMLYGHFASLRWDLPNLSTGVYMLRITGKGIDTCKRVVVIN